MSNIRKANLIKTAIQESVGSYKSFDRQISSTQLDGSRATALVLGGVGFRERHIAKHSSLYGKFNFNTMSVLSTIKELSTPNVSLKRGKDLS